MRIAYIILAHKLPGQLVRLVRKLNTKDVQFFIHVDKKTGDETYREMAEPLREYDNVFFLKRHVCIWGDFGHVEATLEGIRTILGMGLEFDYVMLLTGQDYPIKSNKQIHDALNKSNGNSFIENFALPSDRWKDESGGMDRLNYLYFNWRGRRRRFLKTQKIIPRSFYDGLLRVAEILQIRPRLPENYTVFGGSSYWCLSRECIEYINDFVNQHPDYVKYFRQATISDEIFFQTILMNSPLKDHLINNDMRYIVWTTSSHPKIITRHIFDELISTNDFFARKFDATVDSEIMDMLDQATA